MRQQIHAETLVKTLLEHYNLEPERMPFYFFRVRANGLLEARDFKPRFKSFEIPKCNQAMFEPFERRAEALQAPQEQQGADNDDTGGSRRRGQRSVEGVAARSRSPHAGSPHAGAHAVGAESANALIVESVHTDVVESPHADIVGSVHADSTESTDDAVHDSGTGNARSLRGRMSWLQRAGLQT
jgi:hypothetical protein